MSGESADMVTNFSNNDRIVNIIKACGHYLSMLRIEDLRPVSEFLGVTTSEVKPFSPPISVNDSIFRMRKNLWHFKINYFVLGFCVAMANVLTSPITLILFFLLIGGWYYGGDTVMKLVRDPDLANHQIRFYSITTTPKILLYCSIGLSIIIAAIILHAILLWTLLVSSLLVTIHSIARDNLATIRIEDIEEGELVTKKELLAPLINDNAPMLKRER
jgi:hypothetical protein